MTLLATTLPYELLFDCLDFAATHPLNPLRPDYKCLRNLSLVSKEVSFYAQKALFHSVFLLKNRHALAFGNAIDPSTEKGRWLAGLVTTLKAQVRKDRGSLTQQLFTAALLACPNLRELNLDFATSAFDMLLFSTIFTSQACPIEALRIASPSSATPEILRMFPSLKFVEFKSPVTSHVPHGNPPLCRLTELHWLGPVHNCLLWILHNSVGSLEILSLASCRFSLMSDEDQFERLMSTYGPSLRSLHIPSLPDARMASLRHCNKLEELIVGGMPSEMTLGKLPETIEHLQIQFTDDEQVVGYSNSIFSYFPHFIETAPSLLTLTWVHESAPIITGLQDLCDRRGIIWRGWTQPYGMYPGERQELGHVDTFPRVQPMSPLRARDLASANLAQETR